jgi:hypothetical protein
LAAKQPFLRALKKTKNKKMEFPERRSAIMRSVKGRDAGPEKKARRLAWSIAPGYRLNRDDLPGKPDIDRAQARDLRAWLLLARA